MGGIKANSELSAEFIYDNLQIQNNLINAALRIISKFSFFRFKLYISKIFKTTYEGELSFDRKIRNNK